MMRYRVGKSQELYKQSKRNRTRRTFIGTKRVWFGILVAFSLFFALYHFVWVWIVDLSSSSPPLPRHTAIMDVFVLTGQSNMAGRGLVEELDTERYPVTDKILRWSPKSEWERAKEPMHVDIDLKKAYRCGVGPGFVFAHELCKLQECKRTIGLIPLAIGGSALDEWEKDSTTNVYFETMAETVAHALLNQENKSNKNEKDEKHVLRGLLWYQGETDAMHADMAATYASRLVQFIADARSALNAPDLPVLVVKIETRAYERLQFLTTVQEAQAQVAREVPGVFLVQVAEAEKLSFFEDNLHLQTSSYVTVGKQMARVFASI